MIDAAGGAPLPLARCNGSAKAGFAQLRGAGGRMPLLYSRRNPLSRPNVLVQLPFLTRVAQGTIKGGPGNVEEDQNA